MLDLIILLLICTSPFILAFGFIYTADGIDWLYNRITSTKE